jgi:hypothetical protein
MKKLLIALSVVSCFAAADEGMWMPKQLPEIADKLKAAGLTIDPNDISKLTEFPAAAIVSLGGCSASFVSPDGLVATNHHCAYNSIAHNSTPDNDLLANGFLAKGLDAEVPAAPGSRIFVTKAVDDVTNKVIDAKVTELTGKARLDAIEDNQKALVAECEEDEGHRCTVAAYYGSLEYYLIKQAVWANLAATPITGCGHVTLATTAFYALMSARKVSQRITAKTTYLISRITT